MNQVQQRTELDGRRWLGCLASDRSSTVAVQFAGSLLFLLSSSYAWVRVTTRAWVATRHLGPGSGSGSGRNLSRVRLRTGAGQPGRAKQRQRRVTRPNCGAAQTQSECTTSKHPAHSSPPAGRPNGRDYFILAPPIRCESISSAQTMYYRSTHCISFHL